MRCDYEINCYISLGNHFIQNKYLKEREGGGKRESEIEGKKQKRIQACIIRLTDGGGNKETRLEKKKKSDLFESFRLQTFQYSQTSI